MAQLSWDAQGQHLYETGVDHVALFVFDEDATYGFGAPTAWNGITNITQKPSGGEANPIYADNIKYLNLQSPEDFGISIGGYNSPTAFDACLGIRTVIPGVKIHQQERKTFALYYRTKVGNDLKNNSYGFKHHFVTNATAQPSEKGYETESDDPSAIEHSWEVSCLPGTSTFVDGSTNRTFSVAHWEIDTTTLTTTQANGLDAVLEAILDDEGEWLDLAVILQALKTGSLPTE